MKKYHSLSQIRENIFAGKLTCVELVTHYLQNIQAHNGKLNAFLEVYEQEAFAQAKAVDAKVANGTAGKLAGMVVSIKDVISHENHGLQAASKILDGFKAVYNATVVERLLAEDAIVIGRCNCDEFAMGSSNENSAFGAAYNAVGENRVPGGSSGGSAVSVQADMCLVALGSDTGGSVRQPASFCGIYGLKPTYSRISRWGLIAYASSFDCIGVFANNVEDIATTLEIIAGNDNNDSTVSSKPIPPYKNQLGIKKSYKVAYLKEGVNSEGIDEAVKKATLEQLEKLKAEGHTVEQVEMPILKYALPTYYILTTAEASSNLSRYDGVRYGYRSPNTTDLMSMYKKTRSEGFGKEVKKRIMLGTFVLSASYYDAYFTKAQKVRRLIKNEFSEVFAKYDFIIMPTSPITAWEKGKFSDDAMAMYLADVFTVTANIAGIPGISVPISHDASGLPIGLQVLANDFEEEKLLQFANHIRN